MQPARGLEKRDAKERAQGREDPQCRNGGRVAATLQTTRGPTGARTLFPCELASFPAAGGSGVEGQALRLCLPCGDLQASHVLSTQLAAAQVKLWASAGEPSLPGAASPAQGASPDINLPQPEGSVPV